LGSSDPELIVRYLAGEGEAARVVDGWLRAASAPFRRRLGADGEDVLQEIRLEVLRMLQGGRFRGESSLKTYLWRVACCTSIDALRRRRPTYPLEHPEMAGPAADPSPFDRVLASERQQACLIALQQASPECRALWRLILDGLSYREIGGQLGVAESALRVRAHRCRKQASEALTRCLEKRGDTR
jgi:RNA polymerase sigma-70 factor (ECF subfamily)